MTATGTHTIDPAPRARGEAARLGHHAALYQSEVMRITVHPSKETGP